MKKTISILLILVVVLSSFVLAEANGIKVEGNQPTAKPFIMENDQLLEGYREKPSNPEND